MKLFLVFGIFTTFVLMVLRYRKDKALRELLIAITSFIAIISLGVMGNITRPVIPFFLAHILLVVFAWGALLYYVVRRRYLWWAIFSPAVTIILFVIWSLLAGSRYEDIWGSFL